MGFKYPTYRVSYRKNDGTVREMSFVKLSDLPESFLSTLIKGTGNKRALNEGQELVYDVEKRGLRLINYSTKIGEIERIDQVAPQSVAV